MFQLGDVGLGSQVTQTTQIALLHRLLDNHVVNELQMPVYVRYMDDFIMIHQDKEYLKQVLQELKTRLAELKLELNPKTQLMPLSQGFKLLHWGIYVTAAGKVFIRKDRAKINKERRKLKSQKRLMLIHKMTMEQIENSYQCWQASILQQKSFRQVMRMRKYYYQLFERKAPEWK